LTGAKYPQTKHNDNQKQYKNLSKKTTNIQTN